MYDNLLIDDSLGKDARFATLQEITNSTKHIVLNKEVNASGLIVRSNAVELDVDDSDVNTLTLSDTGGGKTRRQVIPMAIGMIQHGDSIIVNDCKGGMTYRYLKPLLDKHGYKTYVLDFRNPLRGNQYNLLSYGAELYKEGKISEATDVFYSFSDSIFEPLKSEKDPFWTVESSRYLCGLCLLTCELNDKDKVTLDNVYNLHVTGRERIGMGNYLKEYFHEEERKQSNIWRLIEGTVMAPNDTQASILSVMTQGLSRLIINDNILDMMYKCDFRASDIGKEKTAVFLLTKDETNIYDSIVAAFIDQIYAILVNMAENEYNGKLPVRVEFLMDEFSNMAKINDFRKKITASRSRNIRWHLVVQSMEQLTTIYGKADARTIIGNCNSWCYMNSSDIDLLKIISDLCGEYDDEYTREKHNLLSVSKLQHFNKEDGECLILVGRNYPYITYLPDISQYEYEPLPQMDIKQRKLRKKKIFNFRKIVDEEREKRINEMLEKNEGKHENLQVNIQQSLDLINKKIKELDEEEKKLDDDVELPTDDNLPFD